MRLRPTSKRSRLLGSLWVVLTTSCVQGHHEVYRDTHVVATQKHAPLYPLNVHGGDTVYLRVGGRSYRNVRGTKPFYLELPQMHSILFVTEGQPYKVTFHIVDLENKKEIDIDGDGSGFGWDIGSGRTAGAKFTDYVERVGTNEVVVATRSGRWKSVYTLNLKTKLLERTDTFYYGEGGQVTNHIVSTKGKRQE